MHPIWLLMLLCLASTTRGQYSELNDEQKAFIDEREAIVVGLAKKATELHARRFQLVTRCECSRHGCGNEFLDLPCAHYFGSPPFCKGLKWRIDVEDTIFRTAPGFDPRNISDSIKENVCVYKHIIDYLIQYKDVPNFPWTYVATLDGHYRRYPASARRRGDDENGEPLLNGCLKFDARLRPWFIAASTGPKDIVLAVDCSGSMDGDVGGESTKTKWEVTVGAVERILETFGIADFVNVVLFSNEATTLYETGLRRSNREHIKFLKKALSKARPGGGTNFTAGFEKAFDQLSNHCEEEPRTCSNCQKIILFLTDGIDNSANGKKSVKPTQLAKTISGLQDHLVKKTKKRATIFTYSISDQADDAIPRQVACSNDGAWSFIGHDTDPLDALNSYYLYLAAGRKNVNPIWVEPFEDAGGLGMITTVAMPFFAEGTREVPDVFLGVAGHDVLLHELEVSGATDQQVLGAIIDRTERCTPSQSDACELQAYRNARDARGVCIDPYPIREKKRSDSNGGVDVECYAIGGTYFKRFPEKTTWRNANKACEKDGGALASIKSIEELATAANLASPDGSWIGAKKTKKRYPWLNAAVDDISTTSSFWALGEPSDNKGTNQCVAIDTRGIQGNLYTHPCKEKLTYICEYASKDRCTAGVAAIPKKGYFEVPALKYCGYILEVLDETKPIDKSADLESDQVVCPFGPIRTSEEVLCCDSESKKKPKGG